MVVLYTDKGSEIYLDDDVANAIKNKIIHENNNSIFIYAKNKRISIGAIIFPNRPNGCLVLRIDRSSLNYQRSNLIVKTRAEARSDIFKKSDIPYRGVTWQKVSENTYATAYYYIKGKKVNLGYYYYLEDAAIVREYTIRKNNLQVMPTNISLSDEELEEKYKKVVERTISIKENNKQYKKAKIRETRIKNMPESKRKYGIVHKNNAFSPKITINEKPAKLGSYKTYEEAAIVRNCFIVDNKLDLPLVPLEITIEEQLARRKEIRSTKEIKQTTKVLNRKYSGKYKGVNTSRYKDRIRYLIVIRHKDKRLFIGSSKDIKLAAIMYNIYVIENKITDEVVNDVEMTLEEQKEYVKSKGYVFENNRFIRQYR